MKKFILIFCSLILCLNLISCAADKEEGATEETVKPMDDTLATIFEKCGIKFEPNRSELPTYEELTQIKKGMTYSEVYALVGHPQNWDTGNLISGQSITENRVYFIYKSSDGKSIKVFYSGPVDESYIMYVNTIG